MSRADSISDLAGSVIGEFGQIDFLFNNAGMIHRAPAEEFPLDKWEEMIRTNLTGPFLLSQLVAQTDDRKRRQGIDSQHFVPDRGLWRGDRAGLRGHQGRIDPS